MVDDTRKHPSDEVISIELGVSRRKLMKQLSAAGIVGGLAGCSARNTEANDADGQGSGTASGQGGDGGVQGLPDFLRVPITPPPTELNFSSPNQKSRKMVFVSHVAGNESFIPTIVGMNDGLHKNGWKGEWLGPAQNDPVQQIETINTTLNRLRNGRDVLATTVLNPGQYLGPVKNAIQNNIPVVMFNTTVDKWDQKFMMEEFGTVLPYVGQRMIPAGVAVGLTGYDRAKEQLNQDTITVLPTIGVPDHPALSSRVKGIKMAFRAQSDTRVLETLNISNDLSEAISRIETKYSSNPDIDVILGSGWWGPVAGGRLAQNQGLTEKLIVGGFDLVPPILKGIRKGTIDFSGGQDFYSQGYMPTQMAWEYMERGIAMKDYNTGISLVDESNIDFVSDRAGGWTELRNWQQQHYSV